MEPRSETRQALVVDDDRTNRGLAAAVLLWAGFDVHEAASGAQAVSKLQLVQPALLVIDIQLPEIDGLSVVRAVREGRVKLERQPKILVTTALGTPDQRELAFQAGADEVLLVPFPLKRLASLASSLLEVS